MEVYYEQIQKLAHGLQVPTTDKFLIIVFKASLQSYLKIMIAGMKQSTLQQYKEASMLCDEGMTTVEIKKSLLVPQNTKQVASTKTQSNTRRLTNITQIVG